MSERESWLRSFHAANPGVTSRAFARGGSYERLAARIPADARVLELACGDGALLRLLGARAVGLDLSYEEIVRGSDSRPRVQARALALPFADGTFAAVTCHLAFMLFDHVEAVVNELHRVLEAGGSFHALLGGGPTAEGDDAFHAFAAMLPKQGRAFGDRRASSEAGWRELFDASRWRDIRFERWVLDLSGTFDQVWTFLGSSYQLEDADRVKQALRERYPIDPVPLSIATYYASVIRR